MRELTVNYLPGMTWTWLKMNSCNVKVADESVKGKCEIKLPEEVDTKSNVCNPEITGGMGPNFDRFMTKSGIANMIYTALIPREETETVESTPGLTETPDASAWDEIYDYLDDVEKACATEMMHNGIPSPDEIGYELISSSNGAVIGEASMAWIDKKVVLLLPEQEEYNDTFKEEGFTVLLTSEKLTADKFGGI